MCTVHFQNCLSHWPLTCLDSMAILTSKRLGSECTGNFVFFGVDHMLTRAFANVPYVAMRMVPGTLELQLSHLHISPFGLSIVVQPPHCSHQYFIFLTFENRLVTQSRYILLDSPLVFSWLSPPPLSWYFRMKIERNHLQNGGECVQRIRCWPVQGRAQCTQSRENLEESSGCSPRSDEELEVKDTQNNPRGDLHAWKES